MKEEHNKTNSEEENSNLEAFLLPTEMISEGEIKDKKEN